MLVVSSDIVCLSEGIADLGDTHRILLSSTCSLMLREKSGAFYAKPVKTAASYSESVNDIGRGPTSQESW